MQLSTRNLLGIKDLIPDDISLILSTATQFKEVLQRPVKKVPTLRDVTIVNLFYENSTRTRISFELAEKRLSADVVNFTVSNSSAAKGETLLDTVNNILSMKVDMVVMRHSASGAPHYLAKHIDAAIINAGDGINEHPTQALLDALTIKIKKGKIEGLRISICGDIMHSRVARSNIYLLNMLGAEVRVIAPPTLMPKNIESLGVKAFTDMNKGLEGSDIVMMLRLQTERMQGSYVPSTREYYEFYGLDYKKITKAHPNALIMHPGPMNRGVEIDTTLADDINRSIIKEQVEMGVAVRMACLKIICGNNK